MLCRSVYLCRELASRTPEAHNRVVLVPQNRETAGLLLLSWPLRFHITITVLLVVAADASKHAVPGFQCSRGQFWKSLRAGERRRLSRLLQAVSQ